MLIANKSIFTEDFERKLSLALYLVNYLNLMEHKCVVIR